MNGYTQTTGKHYEGVTVQCTKASCGHIQTVARDEFKLAKGGSPIACTKCGAACGAYRQTTATLKPQER